MFEGFPNWRDIEWRSIAAGAFAAFFLIVVILPALRLSAPACNQNVHASYSASHQCDKKEKPSEVSGWTKFWDWTTHDAVSFYTFVLAVFTVALVGVSAWQGRLIIRGERLTIKALRSGQIQTKAAIRSANAADKTARGIDEASERELRAYLFVSLSRRATAHARNMRFFLSIQNMGKTPAYEVVVRCKSVFGNRDGPDAAPALDRENPGQVAMGPGAVITHTHIQAEELTAEDLAGIENGTKAIFIFGEINYTDAFKKARYTRFRYSYCDRSVEEGSLIYSMSGNEAN